MYSPELLDHFQNPRNPGEIESPDASAQVENPGCGDVLKLTLKMDKDRVVDIRFRAKGCVPMMACSSAITTLVKGKTIEAARQLGREELAREVGWLPQASNHAMQLALDALKCALRGLPKPGR